MSDSSRHGLLGNGDYVRLLSGQTISSLGSAMSTFVFTLLAVAITGSPVQAGLVGTAHALGSALMSLPAGALVDRWNRKRVLVNCSGAGAIMYGSVALAGWMDQLTIFHLLLVAFGSGVSRAFFLPAQNAALRHIVDRSDMGTAIAANEGREHFAALVGAPLGGALYSIGRVLPVTFDALSYLVMTVMLTTIRRPLPPPAAHQREPIAEAIKVGVRWLVRQRAVRVIALVATLLNFCAGATVLVLVIELQRSGVQASVIGLLETGLGVGGLLGAMVAPAIVRRFRTGRIAVTASWIIAAAFAATAFTVNPFGLVVCLSAAIFMVPALNSGLFGYQVMVTPDHMQGRAQSAMGFLATSTSPLAPVLGGILLSRYGARAAVLAFAALLMVGAVTLTLSRAIRAIPLLSEVEEGSADFMLGEPPKSDHEIEDGDQESVADSPTA